MDKNEIQQDLFGNNTTNVTSNVTTPDWILQLPENGWLVLEQFFYTRNPTQTNFPMETSINLLKRKFGKKMHMNTLRSMIERLREKAFIKITAKGMGRTRRESRYIITIEGAIAFKNWQEFNSSLNL